MTNQDLSACAEQLDIWCYEKCMETNTSKCKLKSKGNMSTFLNNIKLEATHVQKDLGLMVTPSLPWSEFCGRRVQKATSAFFHLKRNVSSICSWTNKLHSCRGYLVPTYCSQAWLPNKTNFMKFESVQVLV